MARPKIYIIKLSDDERAELRKTIHNKKTSKIILKRCQILLELDEVHGTGLTHAQIAHSYGVPDKLTHAGIYGVEVCMDTLSMLYDIELDYYFRLNFGGFVQIIDALEGITLVSDYTFDSQNMPGFHFEEGENLVNGEQALAFARERYSFEEGDRQRGRNQIAVIKGVADKLLSLDLLKNYSAVMEGIEGSFETNILYKTLTRLVKQQLSKGGDWNIVSYSVDGTGDTQQPYSMNTAAYVMIPDHSTVDEAKELMRQVRDGETLSQE